MAKQGKIYIPFVYEGIIIMAVPYRKVRSNYCREDDCKHCSFVDDRLCQEFGEWDISCSNEWRDDKTEVIFRKIRKSK